MVCITLRTAPFDNKCDANACLILCGETFCIFNPAEPAISLIIKKTVVNILNIIELGLKKAVNVRNIESKILGNNLLSFTFLVLL